MTAGRASGARVVSTSHEGRVRDEASVVGCPRTRMGCRAARRAVPPVPGTEHGRHLGARRRSGAVQLPDRKSTRLNSSHLVISYAVFCLKKKKTYRNWTA